MLLNKNLAIYEFIRDMSHIKSQQVVKDALKERFMLSDQQAQEYLWAWAVQ